LRKGLFLASALLLAALAGCRFADRLPRETATEPASTLNLDLTPGDHEIEFEFEGRARRVIVHIPPAYDGQVELPLLNALHGGGGNAAQVQESNGLDAAADEYGVVVAYPDGSGPRGASWLTWNAGHCCAYALENEIDDVGFLQALIESLVAEHAIDAQRVFLTGISNGGMMAYRAGAELAGLVAGIAPIAGTIGGQLAEGGPQIVPDTPAAPVSVIVFHGKLDQNVLYDGGTGPKTRDGRIDLSVDSSISFWVKANGCNPLPESEEQAGGNILIERYAGCEDGVEVMLVTIMDGGHAWPGARRGSVIGDAPTQEISANEMMLEFFLAIPASSQ
jgi:polyhydroxybutyrate depolymerase